MPQSNAIALAHDRVESVSENNIDGGRFRCAEVLFQPSCIGKDASGNHDKSLQSIMTFDEAPYKTGWESSGSDGVKVAEIIGLQGVPASYGEYIALV